MDNNDLLFESFLAANGLTTDSRQLNTGEIFVAIRGERHDGNEFAPIALEKGASWAVVNDDIETKHARYIRVPDPLKALQQLAMRYRSLFDIPVIAITGSNGKTTTKELISNVLQKKYKLAYTQGNLNNHIGVPLTLLKIKDHTEIAVVEMGANHMGEIRKLCQIAKPTHGLITNIGKAHLEGFGGLTGVINAKTELYTYLHDHDGKAWVNISDSLLEQLAKSLHKTTYGNDLQADIYGEMMNTTPFLELIWAYKEYKFRLSTQLMGTYNFYNILAAVAVGLSFDVDPEQINLAISEYKPENHRSQLVQTADNQIFMDAYNANPTSMKAAIEAFHHRFPEDDVYILGDMLELGEDAAAEHIAILELLSDIDPERVYLVGAEFCARLSADDWKGFQDAEACLEYLNANPVRNKNVLIKGSRSIQLEKLLNVL